MFEIVKLNIKTLYIQFLIVGLCILPGCSTSPEKHGIDGVLIKHLDEYKGGAIKELILDADSKYLGYGIETIEWDYFDKLLLYFQGGYVFKVKITEFSHIKKDNWNINNIIKEDVGDIEVLFFDRKQLKEIEKEDLVIFNSRGSISIKSNYPFNGLEKLHLLKKQMAP